MAIGSARIKTLLPPLWVLILILAAVLGWVAYQLKEILVFLVIGYSIAYVLDPVLTKLEQRGASRPFGLIVILVVGALSLVLLVVTALPTIAREFADLTGNLPQYMEKAKSALLPYLEQIKPYLPEDLEAQLSKESILELVSKYGAEVGQNILLGAWSALIKGYSLALTFINLLILPFIIYYLAVDFHMIHQRALLLFPFLKRERVAAIAKEVDQYVSSYVRGQLTVGIILAVLYGTGLAIIGVELWFVLALIAGLGNLVPYVGFFIGIVLSSVMALVTFGDFTHLALVWGLFILVQTLESTLITPKIVGDKVGLSPLVIILALLAGGSMFGLLGVFLAVPVVALLRVLGTHFHHWLRGQHAL